MSNQNQNPNQEQSKKQGSEEINETELKKVNGGSGLLSGGNDLSNMIGGTAGISNSSSGSNGDQTYSSNDSHQANLGLGNMLNNENF